MAYPSLPDFQRKAQTDRLSAIGRDASRALFFLEWQTELEEHSFRGFEVVHVLSWDLESAEVHAFLHPKEGEWQPIKPLSS